MEYEYDDSVHLHLDYFGTECDMESIAYKRKNETFGMCILILEHMVFRKMKLRRVDLWTNMLAITFFLYMLMILAGNLEVPNLKSGF